MKLSLVLPCYNEAATLPRLIERCEYSFTRSDVEVIIVDNGSNDDTAAVLDRHLKPPSPVRSHRVPSNLGYGHGILEGLKEARGEILAWTHADMQTDPADALTGLAVFERSADPETLFVKGSRVGRPVVDALFSVGMSVFDTLLFMKPLWEINAQPTMFPRSLMRNWEDAPHDFSLDLFVYYSALERGLRVERIAVPFGERAHGTSHWNVNLAGKWRFITRTVDFSLALRRDVRRRKRDT